jgi:N-acetylglucosaminylphosphatidylinositol deacetylase
MSDLYILAICLPILAVIAILKFKGMSRWPAHTNLRKALLVIAHPDDEAMFFVPSIQALVNGGVEVGILCLSVGQSAPGGRARPEELRESARILGISRVIIIDDLRMKVWWE